MSGCQLLLKPVPLCHLPLSMQSRPRTCKRFWHHPHKLHRFFSVLLNDMAVERCAAPSGWIPVLNPGGSFQQQTTEPNTQIPRDGQPIARMPDVGSPTNASTESGTTLQGSFPNNAVSCVILQTSRMSCRASRYVIIRTTLFSFVGT